MYMLDGNQINNQQTVAPAALKKEFETLLNLIDSWVIEDDVEKVHLESFSIYRSYKKEVLPTT